MGYKVTEQIGEDGMVHLRIEDGSPGEFVELEIIRPAKPHGLKPDIFGIHRDRFSIRDDFDEPIPGMEEYE